MAHADIVNSWFREHLAGGALGRATEAYNQVHAALPALIETLDAEALAAKAARKQPVVTPPVTAAGDQG